MPKIPKPLTELEIKNLKPKDRVYKKSDGKGLYIFINPDGRKYFAVEYKSPLDKKIKRLNLGYYPQFSLAMAREERFKILQKLRDGIDIKHQKIINEQSNFKFLAQRWLDIKSSNVAEQTLNRDKRMLEMFLYPDFANRDITSISVFEVINCLKKIEKSGKLDTLRKVYQLLNQIYKSAYFITQNNIISNINYKFTFKRQKEKNYPALINKADIKALINGINNYTGDFKTKSALKFAMLTALRPFNVRSAKWQYIDFEREIIKIPASDMKTKSDFILPLSKQALRLLNELKAFNGSEYIFASLHSKSAYMSENTLNVAIRRMGFSKDEMVSHGFRAMFSTLANEYIDKHGVNFDIIEKCLAHKGGDRVRNTYNHATNLSQMRVLMQWWADFLDSL